MSSSHDDGAAERALAARLACRLLVVARCALTRFGVADFVSFCFAPKMKVDVLEAVKGGLYTQPELIPGAHMRVRKYLCLYCVRFWYVVRFVEFLNCIVG